MPVRLLLVCLPLLCGSSNLLAQDQPERYEPAHNKAIPISGDPVDGFEHVDAHFTTFLDDHDIPGAAVAIAKNGKVVYARGYGWADVEAHTPVEPHTLFRIASISKPITAVAILNLVEAERLTLDARPFDMLECFNDVTPEDPRFAEITIDQLLRHRAGFDRSESGDPMFMSRRIAGEMKVPSPPDAATIATWMAGRPLDFAPGGKYAYSNVGYAILGLVIEHVTGEPYETWVRREILAPLNADGMHAGATMTAAPDESRYYARGSARPSVFEVGLVERPYGAWALEPMIAHGGWIASAPALARFVSSLDSSDFNKVLSPAMVETMLTTEQDVGDGAAFYARGWMVRHWQGRGRNIWHSGSLPGTSTLLVRRRDGLSWAILFNSREGVDLDGSPAGASDGAMHRLVNQVDWSAVGP